MKNMKVSTVRALVMLAILVIVAVGYFTAFGIGNLSGFGVDAFALLCPLGYLESLLASKIFVPRAFISFVAVVLLVVVLGRVFCGWICPMPFLQKIFPGIRKKKTESTKLSEQGKGAEGLEGKAVSANVTCSEGAVDQGEGCKSCSNCTTLCGKPNTFKLDSRYGVLLGALGSAAIFGFPVFCLVCPVGLTFAGVFLIMRLFAFGETTWAVVVVPLVLLIEVIFFRKWCSKICPLGAIMSLISGANKTFRPSIDNTKCLETSQGLECHRCEKACPEHIDIRTLELSEVSLNNCTKCRECAEHCPSKAITFPFLPKSAAQAAVQPAVVSAVHVADPAGKSAAEPAVKGGEATPKE
jgi:ferredoxin-type protein NapH